MKIESGGAMETLISDLKTEYSIVSAKEGTESEILFDPKHQTQYKLIKVLGRGNMGTVCLAMEKDSEKLFALKIMSKEAILKKDMAKRVAMEKEVLQACTPDEAGWRMRSPFLPSLRAQFETENNEVLAIDYCAGGDLNGLRIKQPCGRFTEEQARFYGAQVVLALEYMHSVGYVYRDLKPENVLIRSTGHIMLADFDLCLRLKKPDITTKKRTGNRSNPASHVISKLLLRCVSAAADDVGASVVSTRLRQKVTPVLTAATLSNPTGRSMSFVGTAEYVAPEILWGTGHDLAVDWWTLGVFLFELVFGCTPFRSPVGSNRETFFNILTKEPCFDTAHVSVSPQFVDLLSRLLTKQPKQRLGSFCGVQDIKSHPFFVGVCWDSFLRLAVQPPFTPQEPHLHLEDLHHHEFIDF